MDIKDSLVDSSIRDGVELEKCVVAQHRTTTEQKNIFVAHLKTCTRNKIPIEWVIGEFLFILSFFYYIRKI